MKTRRTLLSVIGMSFLSCMNVHAQSKSKKSKSRKSEKSLPMKRTFNVFGYILGTKITEWKDVERLTDKKYKDDFEEFYKIKNPNFSPSLKDFDNIVIVQKKTSLAYKIEFKFSKENPSDDDKDMIVKKWEKLKAALVSKYKEPSIEPIFEESMRADTWKLGEDSTKIFLFYGINSGTYGITLTYTLRDIEVVVESDKAIDSASKRLGIDLSNDPNKKKQDLSNEVP